MMPIKKISYALFTLLFITVASYAQKAKKEKTEEPRDENKYKKLENYYSLEKYIDCLYKAEGYMEKENYSKDPEPYLYASMCYLAIYKDPDPYPLKKYPELKNPLKDALSNFAKFRKRDKTGEVYEQNKSFADELRGIVMQETEKMYEKKDITHLSSTARDISKAYDKDEVMLMISGAYLSYTNNLSEGIKAAETAMAMLKPKAASAEKPKYTADEEKALAQAFIVYSDYLMSRKDNVNAAKAKDAITLGHTLLTDNDKVSKQFEKINGGAAK
jgi:hypothetical protein